MEIKNKVIFVTGGAGFIGSHLVDRFIQEGAEKVLVYDNFSSGSLGNLEQAKESGKVEVIEGDILDYKKLEKSMSGADLVSHHAAELEVFTGIKNIPHDMKVNIEGTVNVINACLENEVKKLIYASSGGVYGQAKYLPEDEEHALLPHWPYGVSKLAGEKYCTMITQLHGFPTVSLRYSIVYGPREWYGRVLTMFIKRVSEGKPPVIFGSGEQRRDFVYVDDVIEANVLAIKNNSVNGDYFNVSSGKATSVKELAELVLKAFNSDLKPVYDDPPEGEASPYQPERKRLVGELIDFVLDTKKPRDKLGYEPKTGLEEGIKKEIDWYLKNRQAWEREPRV